MTITLKHRDDPECQEFWLDVDPEIRTKAQACCLVGAYFEERAADLFQATRYATTNRQDFCPDLSLADIYFECKAVGRHRTLILFQSQLDKYLAREQEGYRHFLLIWAHDVATEQYTTKRALYAALDAKPCQLLLISFARLARWCRRHSLTSIPYQKNCRKPGWRIPWRELDVLSGGRESVPMGTVAVRGWELEVLMPLTKWEQQTALEMLNELEANPLRVVLIPAPDPRHPTHKVRCVESRNPDWYRKLCSVGRQPRRPHVIRSLERLAQGQCRTPLDWRMRPVLEKIAQPF